MVLVWVVDTNSVLICVPEIPGFCVRIEIGLVFVWVVDIDLISVWEMEPGLISVKG